MLHKCCQKKYTECTQTEDISCKVKIKNAESRPRFEIISIEHPLTRCITLAKKGYFIICFCLDSSQ